MEAHLKSYKYTWKATKDPTRFCCWDCSYEWKGGDTVRVVESVMIPGATDSICNKCYTKRLNDSKTP